MGIVAENKDGPILLPRSPPGAENRRPRKESLESAGIHFGNLAPACPDVTNLEPSPPSATIFGGFPGNLAQPDVLLATRVFVPFSLPWDIESRLHVKFSELVRILERNGFKVVKEKGSIRYYGRPGWPRLVRLDYHGFKEVPTGTCQSILKAAGLKKDPGRRNQ